MHKTLSTSLVALAVAMLTLASPAPAAAQTGQSTQFWWPDQLDLSPLRQRGAESNPLDKDFNYAKAFATLDLSAVKQDIRQVLTTSQPWWPADYGHYGPFFIRMAWHSAGTYRVGDGAAAPRRPAAARPEMSWPTTAISKARRLLAGETNAARRSRGPT
jgi:catalase-peroxidase